MHILYCFTLCFTAKPNAGLESAQRGCSACCICAVDYRHHPFLPPTLCADEEAAVVQALSLTTRKGVS